MGKHVDTTRPVDAPSTGHQWLWPQHRADTPDFMVDPVLTSTDVWSGNPDTDRFWRNPDCATPKQS